MSFLDEVDHDEIAAVTADVEREGQAELMDELEQAGARMIRAARDVAGGSLFEMTDKLAKLVLDQNLNVGELSMLAALLALGCGRPALATPVIERLAKHLYNEVHDSQKSAATDDDDFRAFIERRWNDDPDIRDKYRKKAAVQLAIAFDV